MKIFLLTSFLTAVVTLAASAAPVSLFAADIPQTGFIALQIHGGEAQTPDSRGAARRFAHWWIGGWKPAAP